MIGTVVGSYRIVGEIGSGGMGTIYRAEHSLLGRPAPGLGASARTPRAESVARFLGERGGDDLRMARLYLL